MATSASVDERVAAKHDIELLRKNVDLLRREVRIAALLATVTILAAITFFS